MEQPGSVVGEAGVIFTYLTEPSENATDEETARFERTCDRCGTYVPPEPEGEDESKAPFFTGQPTFDVNGVQVIILFGVCARCAEGFTTADSDSEQEEQ